MAYTAFLHIHSTLRWLVLILSIIVIAKYLSGLLGNKAWKKSDNLLGIIYTSVFDIQFLAGLILYFFVSPTTKMAFTDFGAAMKDSQLRFYAVEHFSLMILALIFVHIGRAKSKKSSTDHAKFKLALVFFTIAIALVIAGIPWSRL